MQLATAELILCLVAQFPIAGNLINRYDSSLYSADHLAYRWYAALTESFACSLRYRDFFLETPYFLLPSKIDYTLKNVISLNLSNSLNINCLPEKLGKMWVNYKGQHYDFIPLPPSNPIPKAILLTKKKNMFNWKIWYDQWVISLFSVLLTLFSF